jgi:drug/metabolite transporter (DMT)-like permease
LLAIVLALGASACYGVSNFIGPQLARRHALVDVLVIGQLAALGVCIVYLLAAGGATLSAREVGYAALAGAGNAGGLIGFYKAAELGPLSIAAPIGALGAIVPALWGIATGDRLTGVEGAGLVLAIAGAALVARRADDVEEEVRYPDPRASVIWAIGSAVAFGAFLTALPAASESGRAWALVDSRLVLVALVAIWAGRRLVGIRFGRSSAPLTIPGLLLVAGTLLYTFAADHGQLSIVSVLGALFPLFTVGLSVALLDDRLSRTQAWGVAAAFAGIALIASGT